MNKLYFKNCLELTPEIITETYPLISYRNKIETGLKSRRQCVVACPDDDSQNLGVLKNE